MVVLIIGVSAVIGDLQEQKYSQLFRERWVSRLRPMGSGVRVSGETEGGALGRLEVSHGTSLVGGSFIEGAERAKLGQSSQRKGTDGCSPAAEEQLLIRMPNWMFR